MKRGKPGRVLVIGDDMRIFLAVVRSFGRAGKEVHAAPFNWHSPALMSRYITRVHHLPRYSDDPSEWRAKVTGLFRKYSFDLVVPCCDRAIIPFHIHRPDFARYPIAFPHAEAVDLLFDKVRTRELCLELGIAIANGVCLKGTDTAQELADCFGLPLVLKPRQSYAADNLDRWGKVWIVESQSELAELLGGLKEPSHYLVESHFEGVGIGVSVVADQGTVLQAFQHRRLREGRGGSSSYRVSEAVHAELYSACQKICTRTRLTGVCMFEFRFNPRNGRWILLETNARFWGSMPLPLSLGVNFPNLLYELMVHGARHAPVHYAVGIRSRNLVLDGFNLVSSLGYLRWREAGGWLADLWDFLVQPVRWLTGRERSDSFVMDDIRPGLRECALLLKNFGQKLRRDQNSMPQRRRGEAEASNSAPRPFDLRSPALRAPR